METSSQLKSSLCSSSPVKGIAPLSTQRSMGTSLQPLKSALTFSATSSIAAMILSWGMYGLKVLSSRTSFSFISQNL